MAASFPPLASAAQQLADQLTAAGVTTYTDARDLELPAGLLAPGPASTDALDASVWTVAWELYLVAPAGASELEALATLSDLAGHVVALCGPVDVTPLTLTLANQSADPLPAFRITIPTTVSGED